MGINKSIISESTPFLYGSNVSIYNADREFSENLYIILIWHMLSVKNKQFLSPRSREHFLSKPHNLGTCQCLDFCGLWNFFLIFCFSSKTSWPSLSILITHKFFGFWLVCLFAFPHDRFPNSQTPGYCHTFFQKKRGKKAQHRYY